MTTPDTDRPRLPRMPPCVRVTATYPATDGRAPETVEVVWETSYPGASMIVEIIAALAAVTRDRP